MPDALTFGLFMTAAVTLLLIPGPAVVYIVATSVEHGRLIGIASVVGVAVGGITHVVGAAIGLSAVLVQSATAFTAIKLFGAAYLVWLGVQRLVRPSTTDLHAPSPSRRVTPARAFRQGVVVNVLNPKVALFFLAFLPQFVDPTRGSALTQTLVLGYSYLALGVVTDGAYAMVAGTVGQFARRHARLPAVGSRVTGLIYIALGVLTALTRRNPSNATVG